MGRKYKHPAEVRERAVRLTALDATHYETDAIVPALLYVCPHMSLSGPDPWGASTSPVYRTLESMNKPELCSIFGIAELDRVVPWAAIQSPRAKSSGSRSRCPPTCSTSSSRVRTATTPRSIRDPPREPRPPG
jgi:hypothetical protein